KYEPWNSEVQSARAMLAAAASQQPGEHSTSVIPQTTINELRALGYLTAQDEQSHTDVSQPSLLPDAKDKIEEQNLLHSAMIASTQRNATRTKDPRRYLQKALLLDPKFPTALRQLGELELQAGNFDLAAKHFEAALEIVQDASTWFEAGEALAKLLNFPAARD